MSDSNGCATRIVDWSGNEIAMIYTGLVPLSDKEARAIAEIVMDARRAQGTNPANRS